jgi:uncharacterized membrane protein YphA (DoxX/SURF4 family)
MKKQNTIYWITTILFAAFMIFTAIPNIMLSEDAVKFIGALGYPTYFIVYIGIVKTLGGIALVIPGFPRITEWAYAGLFFDLISAIVSLVATGNPIWGCFPIFITIAVGAVSYIYFHKRLNNIG